MKIYSLYKVKSISMQNKNSCQTCSQHKNNNKILASILSIYSSLQLFKVFIIAKDDSFIFKALLLLTCTTRMFTICFPRSKQYHLSLDELINKVFEPK